MPDRLEPSGTALNRVQAKLERTSIEAEPPPMPTTVQSSNDELAKLLQNAVDGTGKKHERVNVDIGSGLSKVSLVGM